jgi:hypothetical protein
MRFKPNNQAVTSCRTCGATIPIALVDQACPRIGRAAESLRALGAFDRMGLVVMQLAAPSLQVNIFAPRCSVCGDRHSTDKCPAVATMATLGGGRGAEPMDRRKR